MCDPCLFHDSIYTHRGLLFLCWSIFAFCFNSVDTAESDTAVSLTPLSQVLQSQASFLSWPLIAFKGIIRTGTINILLINWLRGETLEFYIRISPRDSKSKIRKSFRIVHKGPNGLAQPKQFRVEISWYCLFFKSVPWKSVVKLKNVIN